MGKCKKQENRVRIKYESKYQKQKDKQDDNCGSLHSSGRSQRCLSPGHRKYKGLQSGCRRFRNDAEMSGNEVSKNNSPTPESRDEKEMEVGKGK